MIPWRTKIPCNKLETLVWKNLLQCNGIIPVTSITVSTYPARECEKVSCAVNY